MGWGVPDEHYFIKIQIYDVVSPHFHDFSKNMVIEYCDFDKSMRVEAYFVIFKSNLQ